jgi:Holliday junction resolvasome RuvABC endonuclease subunit
MAKKKYKVISLDISSTSTGWCYIVDGELVEYDTIRPKKSLDKSEKLVIFREELKVVLKKFKPNYIVIEDGFFGKNVKTLKVLSNFAGVAIECCFSTTKVTPYIMSNSTPKSYFKVKNKKELFEKVVKMYKFKDFDYDEHNDITDAIAQGICYYDTILKGTWG